MIDARDVEAFADAVDKVHALTQEYTSRLHLEDGGRAVEVVRFPGHEQHCHTASPTSYRRAVVSFAVEPRPGRGGTQVAYMNDWAEREWAKRCARVAAVDPHRGHS